MDVAPITPTEWATEVEPATPVLSVTSVLATTPSSARTSLLPSGASTAVTASESQLPGPSGSLTCTGCTTTPRTFDLGSTGLEVAGR